MKTVKVGAVYLGGAALIATCFIVCLPFLIVSGTGLLITRLGEACYYVGNTLDEAGLVCRRGMGKPFFAVVAKLENKYREAKK